MSGSRRNRILNLNQSTALPSHHTLQSSHQQVGSTPAPHHQPAPTVNNATASGVNIAPRPMVIQYAVPSYPPGYTTATQTRPQLPSEIPTSTRTLPPPSPTRSRTIPTTDFAMDRLTQSLVAAVTPVLTEHQNSLAADIKKVQGSAEKFSTDVQETRIETDKRLFQLTEAMQKSLQMQHAHMKATNKRIEKIETLIMASLDLKDASSLASRLENIQYTVGELSERMRDPGAQELFIAPQPNQTANDIETPVSPTPPESVEERPSTPVQRMYEDKSMSCDIPEPLPERAPTPVRHIYKDAASDAMNLEPESPVMTSLIRPEYKSVGNGARTLFLPRTLQRTLSSSSFELPSGSESDRARSSVSSFRGKSSEVTTVFDEGSRDNMETPADLEEVNSSPRLEMKRMNSFNSSEEELEGIVTADSEGDNSMVVDIVTSVDAELHIESELELKMSTDNEVHDDAQMDDEHESDSPKSSLIEDSLIITSRSSTPAQLVEGSVAELRQMVFSSREGSTVAPSQEQRPLPSPATTPSAHGSPKHELSAPPTDSAPATMPGRQSTPKRPVFNISSPTLSSSLEREASLSKPDCAEPTSIPVPTPLTPESAPLPNVTVTPNSDDGSELSVSRMIAAQTSDSPEIPRLSSPVSLVLEHVEQPQTQASLPLFLPGSRSQSPPPAQSHDAPVEFLESPPPSPKPTTRSPLKSQSRSVRPTTPVVKQTSPTKAPATIFNTPYKKLRRGNSNRSIISIKSTPQKTPTITRKAILRTTRPPASPRPKPVPEPIFIHSSPIFVLSRSSSPLSPAPSASESELDLGSDTESAVVRVVRKQESKKSSSSKVKTELNTNASTSTGGAAGSSTASSTGGTRHIDLLQKLQAKKGESAALTRVRKRKAPTAEQMEPPLKRARQKASASAAEVEREVRGKRGRPSLLSGFGGSGNLNGRGKGKGKERERDDEKGYKLSNKTKTSSVKEEKKSRSCALPLGVKWPQKNMSGDKKFNQQDIHVANRCFTWYHYGCVGIMNLNDPIVKGNKTFMCPPCTGGGDNIVCARPDCEKEEKQDDEFFMIGIIGRHTKVCSGTGRKYMWLVKWDGYSIGECTWEEEEGMSDPQSFIQDFHRKATSEGKDPDEDPYSTILLHEAIRAGWRDPNA
ncbi:hypothetical protein C0995_000785 [Termitomyces sp. Mi166|nr:hypothetical protein C0995_000785 [Termitomyces sp. Mi166\